MTTMKVPSQELKNLIEAALDSLRTFAEIWEQIKVLGDREGFTEQELKEMIAPGLKKQLSRHQIYYLFNKDEKLKQVKDYQNMRKFPQVDDNKELEDSSIPEVENISPDVTTYTSRLKPQGTEDFIKAEQPVLIGHDDHNQQKSISEQMELKGFNFSNQETKIFKGNNKHILQELDKLPGSVWIVVVQEVIDTKAQPDEEASVEDE